MGSFCKSLNPDSPRSYSILPSKYLPSRSPCPPNLASVTAAGLCSLVGCGERARSRAEHANPDPHSAGDETNETSETGRRASPDGRLHGPVWALRVPSAVHWLAAAPPIEMRVVRTAPYSPYLCLSITGADCTVVSHLISSHAPLPSTVDETAQLQNTLLPRVAPSPDHHAHATTRDGRRGRARRAL